MKRMDEMLELLKEKPLSVTELKDKLKLSLDETATIIDFFVKFECISVKNGKAIITDRGLKVLELPDLPE